MHKKKIMHVTFDMRIGGTEMVIKNIIQGSDKDKYEMSVLCIESPLGPFADDLIAKGIQFHQLSRKPGFDFSLINVIRKIIHSEKIDILHCHQYTPWVYGVIAAAFTKTKVIFTEHGRFYPDSSSWKRNLINPLLNLFTGQITAISKATKQALVEYENLPEKDIEVIYNGIAPLIVKHDEAWALRNELGINDHTTILGTIARLDPIKNHSMMLKAFSLVLKQAPDTVLIIVGDGEERVNIESKISKLQLEGKVILTGYQAEPKNYLALMDIYLLSSLSEGTSMTLLEAMSLGKPCVVTNAGGNPEIINDKVSGFVTTNDNCKEFSQAICKALSSSSCIEQLSESAGNRYTALFTDAKMNMQYAALYEKSAPTGNC